MRFPPFFAFLLFSLTLLIQTSFAREADPNQVYRIETNDGNVYFGTITSQDSETLIFNTSELGEITLMMRNIKTMDAIDSGRIKNGAYWFPNPHATRYFFSPSAIGLKQGEGYYQNTWILFNNASFGITDNFSLGAGLVPMFLFGTGETPIWLLPKLSIPVARENVHLSVGALTGTVLGLNETGFGIVYGTSTFGSADRNLTLGLGYGYLDGQWAERPLLNVSGMIRITRTAYFISENYFIPNSDVSLGSVGIRWAPEIVSIDFGLFRTLDGNASYLGFPWLGLAIPFGR